MYVLSTETIPVIKTAPYNPVRLMGRKIRYFKYQKRCCGGADKGFAHLEAGDLVQRSRPSVGAHVILLSGHHRRVVAARAGVGQLN